MLSRSVGVILVVGALVTPGHAAAPTPRAATAKQKNFSLPKGAVRAKYALRVLGMKIGEPEVHLGPVEASKSGAPFRTLRFECGTWGKLRRLYPFDTSSISVIDGVTHRPKRTVIKMLRGAEEKKIDMRFKGNHAVGTVTRDGEVQAFDDLHDHGMVDTISSVMWIVARDLKPGESTNMPHHSGSARYWLWVEAKGVKEVRVPAGTFDALEVVCTLYRWEEGLPSPKTKPTVEPATLWTLWVGRDAYRTPVKVSATVAILGDVVVELEARRFK